jgi:hypothetical protein
VLLRWFEAHILLPRAGAIDRTIDRALDAMARLR